MEIGKSFGVYALAHCGLDIAVPRRETAVGNGHRDFRVETDPFIGTKAAAERRDFTVNAMMMDILTGKIIDHYGGRRDLRRHILRHVSDRGFPEDPLRVLRGAQFAARLGFRTTPETIELYAQMDLTALTPERVCGEIRKALLQAEHPSVFFEILREAGQLDIWFPEVRDLIGVPQPPVFHAEGDVWTHTMLVLDAAAQLKDRASNPFAFMLSALAHDFGKPYCTAEQGGALHAYDHEKLGLQPAERFLRRITGERAVISYVMNMVENHMRPNTMAAANSRETKTNHLFDESVDPEGLIALALADGRGCRRPGSRTAPNTDPNERFLMARLAVYREIMSRPGVQGQDLIQAGLTPSAAFSDILAYAHKLRLAGETKEAALRQALGYARKQYGLTPKQ